MARPYTLITGASGGIGLALAEEYAENGHPVILVARNGEALEKAAQHLNTTHKVDAIPLDIDLTEPGAPADVYRFCADRQLLVDQVINNAGFGLYGPFHQIPLAEHAGLIDLNIRVLTDLSYRFIPLLLQFPNSRLVNVASTASFFPGPMMATYYASKAYVLSLSEALAEEYRTSHLGVCALCPGPTKSGFQSRASMAKSRVMHGNFMTAEQVARIAYPAIQHGDPVIIPGLMNKLASWFPRFLPRNLVTRIISGAQEPV